MASTALFPGSYKPPHIGHYLAAKIASQTADKVIVFVGSATRDGITQDMAVDLWELYTAKDDKIEIRVSKGSPVTDVYDFIKFEAEDDDTIYFIKGKKADIALRDLEFTRKKIAKDISKTVKSAISNAENNYQYDIDNLFVKEAYVGKSLVMKRYRPRAKGRASPIKKPFSRITIILEEKKLKKDTK